MTSNESSLIAELNDLLQLDHDAVEAYTIAIDRLRDGRRRETLVEYRADHKRHIEELAALIRERGGLPTEMPHATGAIKLAVQALGAIGSDVPLLLAFKAVEGQVRDKYQRAAQRTWPDDVAEVIRRAADDEMRHYAWVEGTLRELGAGSGTLPHGIAAAVERVHKLLADPLEEMEREVKRRVGQVVGTTRTRGGAEAPLPTDGPSSVDVAQQFIDALRALEERNDIERMVALFDETAELSNPMGATPHVGHEGAREFWRTYRDSFEEIRSDFSRVVETGDAAMMEWTSRGRTRSDKPIDYSGVSVIEARDGKVHRFRAYFDSKAFEEPGA